MNRHFLRLTVFLTGLVVMAVELTASRLLAPAFGSSLFVWTNLIGVVLFALSAGYYFGGKLADRHGGSKARGYLFGVIFLTGILITLVPLVSQPVFGFSYRTLLGAGHSVLLTSLVATGILFAVPLLLLGMVTPLAARIALQELKTAGSVVGQLYAFSTVGSLVGTFLPVLVMIPHIGSEPTFFFCGGGLMLLGLVGLKRPLLIVLLPLPLLVAWLIKGPLPVGTVFRGESVYSHVEVREMPSGTRMLLTDEGIGAQSIYHPQEILTGMYFDYAALLPLLYPEGRNFLFVGLGAGTSARIVAHFFPKISLTGVEIDPLLLTLGQRFFALDEIPVETVVADARVFLEQSGRRYDFIMVDVYKADGTIPFHLATREFFETVKSRLTPHGILYLNTSIPTADSKLVQVFQNTLAAVFPYTYESRLKFNSLFFAFKEPLVRERLASGQVPKQLQSHAAQLARAKPIPFDPGGPVSQDAHSQVELLSGQLIFDRFIAARRAQRWR